MNDQQMTAVDLISDLGACVDAMHKLSASWETYVRDNPNAENVLSALYPFHLSFDDLCAEAQSWREHVTGNLSKTNPATPLRRPANTLDPAGPGEVWILERKFSPWMGVHDRTFIEPNHTVDLFTDPRMALHDLAGHVRDRWEAHREARRLPTAEPPAHDIEAVAVFYASPSPRGSKLYDTFKLYRSELVTRRAPRPAWDTDHVLVRAYGEITCECGNESDGEGFYNCDPYGRICEYGPDSYVLCWTCGRVIETATGRVVVRLPLCRNCNNPVALLQLIEPHGGLEIGDLVWKHVTDEGEHIRCADAHGLGHDGVAKPKLGRAR